MNSETSTDGAPAYAPPRAPSQITHSQHQAGRTPRSRVTKKQDVPAESNPIQFPNPDEYPEEHFSLYQDIKHHYEGFGFDTTWKSYRVTKQSYSGLLELLGTSPGLLTHFLSLRSNYDPDTGNLSIELIFTKYPPHACPVSLELGKTWPDKYIEDFLA